MALSEEELADLATLSTLAKELGLTETQIRAWERRSAANGFPAPKQSLGKYHIYSRTEVSEWLQLWKIVKENFRRGEHIDAKRTTG